jgi:hypothetical protein
MPSPLVTSEIVKRNGIPSIGSFPKAPPTGVNGTWSWDLVGGAIRGLFVASGTQEVFDTGADNASLADGINIVDLPAGVYLPIMGRVQGTLSNSLALGENANGEIGIGTVVGSGAVAVLGGTATFENWMDGQAIAAITAGASVAQNHAAASDAGVTESLGGALSLYLNIAAAFSDEAAAHKIQIDDGFKVEILFYALGVTPATNQV